MLLVMFVLSLSAALPSDPGGAVAPNILLIIADDLGVDRVGAYGEHPDPGRTPVIDQLAADGVLFRNVWANPVCSTTRATLLTGRYSFRTGIGSFLGYQGFTALSDDELSLPDILPAGYASAAVGKWHLASMLDDPGRHPLRLGFEHHRGSLTNFADNDPTAYFSWPKNVDGVVATCSTYATTDTVDEALALIAQFGAPPEPRPWLLWVAFNAPHKPYHVPPAHLHSYDLPPLGTDDPLYMRALTEAMDTEIGRLLAGLDPATRANTLIIFVGDNGTAASATTAPFPTTHAKGTTYEGGLNVPLIIAGPGVVAGGQCDALVNSTDLFATVAEFVGVTSPAEDSLSLLPYLANPSAVSRRPWVYAEWFQPDLADLASTHRRAVRDARFKLRRTESLPSPALDQLFDLDVDPYEQHDLLTGGALSPAATAARDRLRATLASLRVAPGTWSNLGWGLMGSLGVPRLSGSGTLVAGDPLQLRLSNARPSGLALLVVGVSPLLAPLYRTTLVPSLDLILTLPTDAGGGCTLDNTWPPGLPSDLALYFQAWPLDDAAHQGVAASNALLAITP